MGLENSFIFFIYVKSQSVRTLKPTVISFIYHISVRILQDKKETAFFVNLVYTLCEIWLFYFSFESLYLFE